ncbi:XRE family transcriptional regulator [Epibacterium sp. Ofav1-8]|uniref:XRE family transcriptional regulator n=1 Tax=Epibacterium sp. Ofav1-8 TaxID=2917735 RepID=UPI001EF53CAB|nr:XRE family transcriptional regulator [Epibacterium sp. Ofav1-8]MCG7625562.1 XRE family transcriptional regulator [Epibacterium sp. Ofav1-8]
MAEVREYAARVGVKPTTVIQRAKAGGGGTWRKWEEGESSPTLITADRVRRYMAENPPAVMNDDRSVA